jgi:hypothetical protein
MSYLLYRGVSKKIDHKREKELCPKGDQHEVSAKHDGRTKHDGKFTYGLSEDNTVRAHHIKSGLYSGCYISTTRDEKKAWEFATSKFREEGWVYVIDESLFDQYGIVAREFPDPQYPDQKEVSIRAADNGVIPYQVIIEKYEVDANGNRKCATDLTSFL